MKKLLLVVVAALFLSGCSYFTANKKLRECESIMVEYEKQLAEADSIIYLLDVENVNLKEDLKECRASKTE